MNVQEEVYTCKACSTKSEANIAYEDLIDWGVYTISGSDGYHVELLICPTCSKLTLPEIVKAAKIRILSGADLDYH